MSQQVVTELVIDANTSGADQFSDAMGRAGTSAQQTILAVAGVSVAVVGIMAGLRSFVDYVGGVNKQLIDLDRNAVAAGMSTREFQQTLFAARVAGLTEKDFVSGLDRIGIDLVQASRGASEFGKLFEANGLSIRDVNGKLKDTKTALSDITGLMQNATPQVQQGIARIVGLSREWIPFLQDGSSEIEKHQRLAEQLGLIIDDATVKKAKEFDQQWRIAVATWDTQFKSSLIELLPLMVKLAGYAVTVIEAVGKVSSFFSHTLTPVDQMGSSDLAKRLEELRAVRDLMKEVGPEFDHNTQWIMGVKRNAAGLPADAGLSTVDAEIARVDALLKKKQEIEGLPRVTGAGSVLPPIGGDDTDAVDRAIDGLRKHTERQLADAKAIGQGAAAQAQYRAEAALTSAVMANGGVITAEQAKQYEALKQQAMAAAEALARARVVADVRFGRNTAFLSQEDVSIAQQLRQIYPDVTQALGSVEAQSLRLNNAMRGLSSSIETNLVSSLADITTGAVSAGQGFDNMSKAIIRAIEEMIIKMTIIQPLMRSLQLGFSSLGLGSFFGGGTISLGNLGGTAGILSPIHHSGGIVGEGTEMRFIHPAYFDNAPRYHGGGIAGLAPDEVPAILQRGERITPRGQSAGGGVSLNVNVINQTGVPVKTETSQDANGDMTITLKKMVEQIGVESIASGDMGRAITTKYGVKQFAGQ